MATSSPTVEPGMHRQVWRLAGPIMISNVSTPLIGVVDTAVVGHLEHSYYLGAVAVGALIFTFVFWSFSFLRMGTTGLTAQASGAAAADEVRAVLARALILAALLGLILILLQGVIAAIALPLINPSADVAYHTTRYFEVRIWSAPATLANYAVLGWLIGMQRAGSALALQLVLNGTNIVLNLLFVVGLGWGVPGVALASVIAEYTALAAGSLLIARHLRWIEGPWDGRRLRNGRAFRRLMAVNRDIFIRTLCLSLVLGIFTSQGAQLGDTILAANAVLLNFHMFMVYALDGFAHASEALVGSRVGARDVGGLRRAVWVSTVWAAGAAALFTIVYAATGTLIIDALTGIAEVRSAARDYLPWAVVAPVISVWSFQLDGIFLGATRTAAMRNAMIVSVGAYVGMVWLIVPGHGNHGLWFAFMAFMVIRAFTLAMAYPALVRASAPTTVSDG